MVGASCLESTRILLNSKIANSSGVLGHYLHDQFYMSNSVVALIPEAKNGKAPRGLVGGSGYIPRFRNLKTKEKNFIRGYAFDFSTGGTPDAGTSRHGARSCRRTSTWRAAPALRPPDGRSPAALREPRAHRQERRRRVGHPGA